MAICKISLDAVDPRASLPVVADLSAANESGRTGGALQRNERCCVIGLGAARRIAGVGPDIEAAPIVAGVGSRPHRSFHRHLSGHSEAAAESQRCRAGKKRLFHYLLDGP